jgi:hypothetical protein
MIQTIGDMIAPHGCETRLGDAWVRAVPLPYRGSLIERLRAAWAVMTEKAFAVRWPYAGDLERALNANAPFRLMRRHLTVSSGPISANEYERFDEASRRSTQMNLQELDARLRDQGKDKVDGTK